MMTTMTAPTQATAVRFVEPLPGFDGQADFSLAAIDPDGVLFSLRSLAEPSLRFVLTPAHTFFDDYAPDLETAVMAALDLVDGAEVTVLLMLTITVGLSDATANLRAPVVIANETGKAVQIVLDDDDLPMRRPLLAAA